MNFETPFDFKLNKKVNTYQVEYKNVIEVGQGGPQVGELYIEKVRLTKELFGGPILYNDEYLFIPIFKRRTFSSGFYICKVNLRTLEYENISERESFIFLKDIKDTRIYFYTDFSKSIEKYCSI